MQASDSFCDVLRQYFAGCVFLPLFVLSLIWIWKKWNKEKKTLLAIGCAGFFVFNELTYRLFEMIGERSTYYRLFWIIPIVLLIAVSFVECIMQLQRKKAIVVFAIGWLSCMMFSGKSGVEWFAIPENIYQIDHDVIQVSDALMELTNGRGTYLLDDGSISNTVRQYNPKVMSTNAEYYLLDHILQERNTNALGRIVQECVMENHSRFVAVEKSKPSIYKVFESGSLKLANETDNYHIYYVDYDQLYEDYDERAILGKGLWNNVTHEYILIPGYEQEAEYVYITDLGDVNNREVYEEVFEKIKSTEADGIIINHKLSENSEWVERYAKELMALEIPCYYNDIPIQVIEEKGLIFCLLDNSMELTEEQLEEFAILLEKKKPIILICTQNPLLQKDSTLLSYITKEDSTIVQVLTSMENGFKKEMLSNHIFQYAAPVNNKQQLNIIKIESLEPKELKEH